MSLAFSGTTLRHTDRFFIGGEWVKASSDAMFDVVDSGTEEVFLRVAEANAADMARAITAAREAFDDGPWPRMSHLERAGYLRALGAGLQERADDLGQIWPRESGVLHSIAMYGGMGAAATFDTYAALGRHVRVRGAGPAHDGRRLRAARARAGRCRRRDHPVERPARADLPQDRARAARRLHRDSQVVAGSTGRGLRRRRSGRGDRPAARRVERAHRGSRGLRAARARPEGRQDHVHRFDGRGPADRVAVRGAHRPLHARARREVGRRHPRRRRPGDDRRDHCRRRVPHLRPGVLVVDAHRRDPQPARRARRGAGRSVLPGKGGRPVRRPRPRWDRSR